MKFSIFRLSPATKVWGFRRIRNWVGGGPTRGVSLYLGTWQFALELR